MKKIIILVALEFSVYSAFSQAPNTWLQKTNFAGTGRYSAIGFSIDNKGYIGTGDDGAPRNDFWEYDPATDTWTQKANFGGAARSDAVGFSIGSKGYVGTGFNVKVGITYNDFWEYDPVINTWTRKTDFGGKARSGAVGFSLSNKGYIGTGYDPSTHGYLNDFWEYDPATNAWTQEADFGGKSRVDAVGFSISSKGYMGTGYDGNYRNDFWEYDPATNAWTQEADFGGKSRVSAVGFSIDEKGYIGIGDDGYLKIDFWEYDPTSDTWTQKANFGGAAIYHAVGFSIGSKGYIGTGLDFHVNYYKDFWEYTPDTSICISPSNPSAINITSTSAKLKWDAVPGAQKYKLRYEVDATNDWIVLYPVAHHKVITDLLPNTEYTWQVKTLCQTDSPSVSSLWSTKQYFTTVSSRANAKDERTPPAIQIYPNPAQDYASIRITLSKPSKVSVILCDLNGKKIEILLSDQLQSGEHSLQLNTSKFSKGVYAVKMITDFGIENQKLIVQ